MRRNEDPYLTILVKSPEGGSTITPEACVEFTANTCSATCRPIGTCALANAVSEMLERGAASEIITAPPSMQEVTRLMDLNEIGRTEV